MERAIWAHRLSKRYGARTAVDGLELEVARGAVFGFLGPNGAGKTTTLRMLLGLCAPTSGSAQVLGLDIGRERARIAQRVGAIVETPTFYPFLGGRKNLEVLALTAGVARSRAQLTGLLERVGLLERGEDPVARYSLGMKQRLGIAAALLGDPEVVFLDEPTNGLDPEGARSVRTLIQALAAEGRTVFLSSHLLHEVEQVCTEVAIVRAGRTVLQGKVPELLRGGGYVVRAQPLERALVVAARAHPARLEGGVLKLGATPAEIPGLVRAWVAGGVDVLEIREEATQLEELFLRTVAAEGEGIAVPGASPLETAVPSQAVLS